MRHGVSWSESCGNVLAFPALYQRHVMVLFWYDGGSINKLFCKCLFL